MGGSSMRAIESFGIKHLFKVWKICEISQHELDSSTGQPILLVGSNIFTGSHSQILGSNSNINHSAHVIALPPGEDGVPRAVISGHLPRNIRNLVEDKGILFLGEELTLASYYETLEECMTAEALALGVASHIEVSMLHRAIGSAAGSSWSWRELVPEMIGSGDRSSQSQSMKSAERALSIALSVAAERDFPAPLISLAKQLYSMIPVSDHSSSARVIDLWSQSLNQLLTTTNPPIASLNKSSDVPSKTAFVGLGAMGYGMANGMNIVGWDVYPPAMKRYTDAGGTCQSDLLEACRDAEVLLLMVINASQADDVLFTRGAVEALPRDAVVLLMSTVAPSQALSLSHRLWQIRPDVKLVDAPVSGGTPRAATGNLTILCAGLEDVSPSSSAIAVLKALSSNGDTLIFVPGGPGKGAGVKIVNQHLAATHIACVAEHLALASKLGLPLRKTRKLLMKSKAQSWMLGHRGQNMLDGLISPPTSAINIFVKDSTLVVQESESLGLGTPLIGLVQQQFIRAKARGWGMDDDSSLVRLWNDVGVDVRCPKDDDDDDDDNG